MKALAVPSVSSCVRPYASEATASSARGRRPPAGFPPRRPIVDRSTARYGLPVGAVEATVRIITGLAWPVVVGFAIWVLRGHIGGAIDQTESFQGLGMKATFRRWRDELKRTAAELPEPPKTIDVPAESG
jgi:hypothetical protein